MSKFTVTFRIEKSFEVNADSAAVAIRRAKNLLSMSGQKSKVLAVKVDRQKLEKKDP